MAIELTVLEVALGSMLAFLAGLFGLLFYYERRSAGRPAQDERSSSHLERLEQYENQLISMKIRLDALSLGIAESSGSTSKAGQESVEPKDVVGDKDEAEPAPPQASSIEQPPATPYDITNHILLLITSKPMTSRDIQITVGRTREHTSRLMKRLTEEGLVKRHSNARPYTYSITERGKERLGGSQ